MKLLFSFALFVAVFTSLNAQESLFDKAVILDSLYNRIRDGDREMTGRVFAQLRGLYPGGENLSDGAIYKDIGKENAFLAPKINYVYNLLEGMQEVDDGEEERLTGIRDSLIERSIEVSREHCKEEFCDFVITLEFMVFTDEAQEIRGVRESLGPGFEVLAAELRAIEVQLYELDVKIDELKQQEDVLFRGGGDVGLGLPVGGGVVVDQGFAPIVVQTGGGSVQGAVIDGASRWIAERMREELSIAFFDRFEVWMEEKKMNTLFPNTVKAFDITASTDYSLMIQILRTAFERDLEELPFNIGPFLRQELAGNGNAELIQYEADEAYIAYRAAILDFSEDPNLDVESIEKGMDAINGKKKVMDRSFNKLANTNKGLNYVLFSIAAMKELSEGNHPANLLGILNQRSDELFPQGGDIRPALMLADILLRSFIKVDPQKGTTWVRRKDLTELSSNRQLREFYYGLVLFEIRRSYLTRKNQLLRERKKHVGDLPYFTRYEVGRHDVEEYDGKIRASLDNTELIRIEQQLYLLEEDALWSDITFEFSPEEVGTMLNELSLFAERMDNLQQQYTSLKAHGQASLGNPQMIQLIRHSLKILQPVLNAALVDDKVQLERIQLLSEGVLDAYTGVLERDYDAVVLNVIPLANTLLDVDFAEAMEANKGENKALINLITAEHGARKRKLQEVFRYSAFLAAVAESRNPEDIKKAIQAIALPTGSYSIKRRNFANISLNIYPGLTGGAELARNAFDQQWAPNFGFTAPVGLAFSWGYRANINNSKYLHSTKYRRRVDHSLDMRNDRFLTGHSGSLFFSFLDLGAVVLFRLDGSDNALPEDVGFQQVFSPGVMYSHGLPNMPISILVGMQVSPQLRKFGDVPADAFRFNLGVTVDLPAANLHTRSVEKEE